MSTSPTMPEGVIVMSPHDFNTFIENLLEKQFNAIVAVVSNKTAPPEKTLLSRKEAAERLKITLPTLSRRLKDGSLPYQKIGRRILVDVSAFTLTT